MRRLLSRRSLGATISPTMDFFAHQDRARSASRRLLILYALSVMGVLITLNVAAVLMVGASQDVDQSRVLGRGIETSINNPARFEPTPVPVIIAITTACVAGIIVLASLFKRSQLGGDGANVAQMMGGTLVDPTTPDPAERKLMNVVEEMAIASGVPVPRVYLLQNETGINAFAAGETIDRAVIGVTRGCVQTLSRDQLQGVVAHEFSHIVNGDMKLNMRLIVLNFGIMALGVIGYYIVSLAPRSSARSSGKDKGAGILAVLAVGLVLMIVGYVGTFFGRLLQAAVSRQREYLADASAVQFTRDPRGISGALKVISGFLSGSSIQSAHAREVSHMFFASGVSAWLGGLTATHPPIEKRIRAIEPDWNGKEGRFPTSDDSFSGAVANESTSGFAGAMQGKKGRERVHDRSKVRDQDTGDQDTGDQDTGGQDTGDQDTVRFNPGALDPTQEHLASDIWSTTDLAARASLPRSGEYVKFDAERISHGVEDDLPLKLRHATALLESLPSALLQAAREPYFARAIPIALLLDADSSKRKSQIQYIAQIDTTFSKIVDQVFNSIASLGPAVRLPLLDLSTPAIEQLSPTQLAVYRKMTNAIARSDRELSNFEIALLKTVDRFFRAGTKQQPALYRSVSAVLEPSSILISGLARGNEVAYRAGMSVLSSSYPQQTVPTGLEIEGAIDRLRSATPAVTRRVVKAVAVTVASDRAVSIEEAELVRAVCAAIDVPVPPMLERAK